MIGIGLGDAAFTSIPATGSVDEVFAQQTALTSIHAEWSYNGEDEESNIYFLVYVNGRLAQRLPGSTRDTDIIATLFESQEIQVIPWRKDMPIQPDIYGSLQATRGHLEWTRPADTTISGYNIYSSETELGTYELYASHTITSLSEGVVSFDAGDSTMEIAGSYSVQGEHTNTLFTVTLIDDNNLEISNDSNADVISSAYVADVPFVPISGIILTISGTSPRSGEASFLLGVQPYYDTNTLEEGTTWFKVAPFDSVGNEASMSSAIPVTITLPPNPVTDVEMVGAFYVVTRVPSVSFVQSDSPDAARIHVYTNYDEASNTLLEDVFMDVPRFDTEFTPSEVVGSFRPLSPFIVDSLAPGTFKMIIRAVDTTGIDDGTTVVHEIAIPVPASTPQPHTITATPTAGGGVDLVWYTSEEMGPFNIWRIAGDITTPYDDASTTAVEEGIYFRYEASVPAINVGADGTYTIEIYGVDTGDFEGLKGSIEVTTDSVAPSSIINLTGTPF